MTRRAPIHLALLISAALGAAWFTLDPHLAQGQQHTGGNGTVTIHNETERQLFWSLICSCGCPRETLGTCPCDFASARREELRDMLAAGKTVEQAQDSYVAQFGTKALAVPRNEGGKRALYAVPVFLILAGAGFAVMTLRKWRARSATLDTAAAKKAKTPSGKRDAYDDKLDQELKDLDDE